MRPHTNVEPEPEELKQNEIMARQDSSKFMISYDVRDQNNLLNSDIEISCSCPPRILIVDDHQFNLIAAQGVIRSNYLNSIHVDSAFSAGSAIEKI